MINKVAVIGATGMLGKPVTIHLVQAGFTVSALVRNIGKSALFLPREVNMIQGDIRNPADVDLLLQGKEAVYISLSVPQDEKKSAWHSETDGMKIILESARRNSIQRIILLSSLVQRYQGMNNFKWWVFDIKDQSIAMVKQSGIPYTIFYPSTFMESFLGKYKQGSRILISGKSEYPMYYISGEDYAKQVSKSLQIQNPQNKEYVIQGPEPLLGDEAAKIFVQHYKKEKLSVSAAPFGLLKFLSNFSSTLKYGIHIIEALNRYPEKFESESAWQELGKPEMTLKQFAETC